MQKVGISVRIGKGESAKSFPATKRVIESKDVNGTVEGFTTDEVVKLINYAEDLKVRASTRGANTDEGGKEARRMRTMAWASKSEFADDVLKLFVAQNKKALNDYLDDLYESDEETKAAIDAIA